MCFATISPQSLACLFILLTAFFFFSQRKQVLYFSKVQHTHFFLSKIMLERTSSDAWPCFYVFVRKFYCLVFLIQVHDIFSVNFCDASLVSVQVRFLFGQAISCCCYKFCPSLTFIDFIVLHCLCSFVKDPIDCISSTNVQVPKLRSNKKT